jgi:UPF0755 protein
MPEAEIMRLLGAPQDGRRGLFFPDTYLFAKRSSDVELLARAYRAMQRHLAREWPRGERQRCLIVMPTRP